MEMVENSDIVLGQFNIVRTYTSANYAQKWIIA
jgi:hypothetical protein